MDGRASWCESLGPVKHTSKRPVTDSPRVRSSTSGTSMPRPTYSNPHSSEAPSCSEDTSDDGYINIVGYFTDEDEGRSINELFQSMTTPPISTPGTPSDFSSRNPSRVSQQHVSIASEIEAASPSNRTCLVGPQRVSDNGQRDPPKPPQWYGAIRRDSSSDGHSDDASVQAVPTASDDGNIEKLPFILISAIMMCCGASSKFHATLVDQYVYQVYSRDILGNISHTTKDPCFHGSDTNSSTDDLVKRVQLLSSRELLYLDLTMYALGVPACIILGLLSRKISRKLQLIIPLFGYNVKCAALVAGAYLQPPLSWLYVAYAVEGACGNFVGVLLGVFLYTSDISGRNRSRTTAMVILEGVRGGVTSALNVVAGNLIENSGFKIPAWVSFAASAMAFLLIFTLPNRKSSQAGNAPRRRLNLQEKEQKERGSKRWFSTFVFPEGTFDNAHVKKMLFSGLAAAFVIFVAKFGMKKVQTLYLMNQPICWSSSIIGWFLFGGEMSSNVFTMVIAPLLLRCMPGMLVGIMGTVSVVGGFVFFAVATKGFQLYFQPALDIGSPLPLGVIRGELSRLVGPEAQGVLFSMIAVLESFSFTLGTPALYLYNRTLGIYKGTVALVAAGLVVVATCILIYFHSLWRKHYGESRTKDRTSDQK